MQIHSFSKTVAVPLALIAGYIAFVNKPITVNSVYVFIPVILLVVLYVFHGIIDHWWISKYPLKFDTKLDEWLQKYFPPYHRLNPEGLEKFKYRLTLYIEGRLFKSIGSEQRDVPYDIKGMIAAHGILIGLNTDDYLIGAMDRIFLYKHPFPTPDHQYLHNVEVNTEDGVIILSLEQVTGAITEPDKYYNVAYHAYAEAFHHIHVNIAYPDVSDSWSGIETVSGWSKDEILKQIGLKSVKLLHVHITLYFSMPDKYKVVFPDKYREFSQIFGWDKYRISA